MLENSTNIRPKDQVGIPRMIKGLGRPLRQIQAKIVCFRTRVRLTTSLKLLPEVKPRRGATAAKVLERFIDIMVGQGVGPTAVRLIVNFWEGGNLY